MGKHKHKSKSKKSKKHSKKSSDSDSDDAQIVWTEAGRDGDDDRASSILKNSPKTTKESANDQSEDLFDFISKTSKNNSTKQQTAADKYKEETVNKEQQIRYSRELNSYFRDDINKRFIDDPEELQRRIHKAQDENNEKEESEEDEQCVSDAELNSLNAKMLKAEMLGNSELANELRTKIDQLKRRKSTTQVKYVNKTVQEKDRKTEDSMTVKELYLKTKTITAREEAMRFVATTSKIRSADDEYEGNVGKNKKKAKFDFTGFDRIRFTTGSSNNDNDRKCDWCLENKMIRHLVLKFHEQSSQHCYVTLTPYRPLIDNVCMIVSKNHSAKYSLDAEQECWIEIRQIMQKLSKFFDHYYKCSIVFMETVFINKKRNQNLSNNHFVIECYPIKKRFETDAKIYFHVCITMFFSDF